MALSISLLDDDVMLSAPFIKVDIGKYEFGVYRRTDVGAGNVHISYPNYVKSLTVDKINGAINQYNLTIVYPITPADDPNFFEKVFSSVSDSRKIVFSYGDFSTPHYIYGNEEAMITSVDSSFDIRGSKITYTVKATGTASLALGGNHYFPAKTAKPSDVIRSLITQNKYGLTNLFTGMRDLSRVDSASLLATDDKMVEIKEQTMSVLEYLNYLTGCMSPSSTSSNDGRSSTFYTLVLDEDKENLFGGPYFKIQKLERNTNSLNQLTTYTLDVGYPGSNIITDFQIENDQSYSILYDYSQDIDGYNSGKRIDDKGNVTYVPANYLTSSKQLHEMTAYTKNWWTKVTELPITVNLTLMGLLRPTLLMQYVKLNVWFYGRKHISSGYYTITAQKDTINESGFRTNLKLLRIAPDGDIDTVVGLFGERTGNSTNVGGSYSGGSSTHTSSSGNEHGGGGRGTFSNQGGGSAAMRTPSLLEDSNSTVNVGGVRVHSTIKAASDGATVISTNSNANISQGVVVTPGTGTIGKVLVEK